MIINVGSLNTVKIRAVCEAIKSYHQFDKATVIGIKVDSQVSNQPFNLEETMQGAKNRAQLAFQDCEYSVGLESGTICLPVSAKSIYLELTACAVYDGNGFGVGLSPAFQLPSDLVTRLKKGEDLEQASLYCRYTKNPDIGQYEGIIGVLSDGIFDRLSYTVPAVKMALIRYLDSNKEKY
ncbi:inosine/xanthosine triphosphatase [Candidatus Woesearchaeota archaeon]|nr:inosine/xanthosine triphosphatase [Candidatus Woesearchaeota archaeon]